MTNEIFTAPPSVTVNGVPATDFRVPLLNPYVGGLYSATTWDDASTPPRFAGGGVRFWPVNFAAASGLGHVELESWCDTPEKLPGDREEPPEAFGPVLVWAADECDMTEESQSEVRDNVSQTLRLSEQRVVEEYFAARLAADASSLGIESGTLAQAVGFLDEQLAQAGIGGGLIHASPRMAAALAKHSVLVRNGARFFTPLGNAFVFGGGYSEALGDTMIATTPTFGWRTPVEVREAFDASHNVFYAMAERTVAVGYEAVLAAASVTGGSEGG